ncbi:hypothetical protein RhiirA4_483871 [Rhizophagus irregularis]|uniref:Uncharacterized protein n=1 Tax=Rhizophagus irregularis TaxID=588596 RepID=A0A2I1HN46_9GLOM|nr:hypothetical protein RhiirA4_483871 [Rhizophagus irregularis]
MIHSQKKHGKINTDQIFYRNRLIETENQIFKSNLEIRLIAISRFYNRFSKLESIPIPICNSLVFISENSYLDNSYQDSHLKKCISEKTISDKHARINEILQFIDKLTLRKG